MKSIAALEQYNKEKEQKDLPSLTLSLLPIVVPIVLNADEVNRRAGAVQ